MIINVKTTLQITCAFEAKTTFEFNDKATLKTTFGNKCQNYIINAIVHRKMLMTMRVCTPKFISSLV